MYFNPECRGLGVNQGTLPDGTFLGTLMAICAFSKFDLIENIFASRPEDFVRFGIYTCRFYVDGDWVEVITDTNIPCIRDLQTGSFSPVYGNSSNPEELWVALVEKAFAKAMGSYEEIPNIKVQKALLHLTGGSVQHFSLKDEAYKLDTVSETAAWTEFKRRFDSECLVLMFPVEKKVSAETVGADAAAATATAGAETQPENAVGETMDEQAEEYFIPDMLYSVVACRDVGGYELVLMHNPWQSTTHVWTGEWSDNSNDWDIYPEIQSELEKDPGIPWRRKQPNGYFWIMYRSLVKYFNKSYACKLFPNDKYSFYCVRGECRGKQAGGPLITVRDPEAVAKEAAVSRSVALQKVIYYCHRVHYHVYL